MAVGKDAWRSSAADKLKIGIFRFANLRASHHDRQGAEVHNEPF